jgi:hypothetical protein
MKLLALLVLAILLAAAYYFKGDRALSDLDVAMHGPYSIKERVDEYGDTVAARLAPDFARAGVAYPPQKITLIILKRERELQLYAEAAGGDYKFIRAYPILAASGHLGPKLREGDWQVPEGIYGVDSLNPNSHYHLALHVGYPNDFDRTKAKSDGRDNLGGDIMIHGSHLSIGCVAMGNSGAEDLFVIAAKVGLPNVHLLFCPIDFRVTKEEPGGSGLPLWTPELYANLERALVPFPPPTAAP